jgi:hypothetical protein
MAENRKVRVRWGRVWWGRVWWVLVPAGLTAAAALAQLLAVAAALGRH